MRFMQFITSENFISDIFTKESDKAKKAREMEKLLSSFPYKTDIKNALKEKWADLKQNKGYSISALLNNKEIAHFEGFPVNVEVEAGDISKVYLLYKIDYYDDISHVCVWKKEMGEKEKEMLKKIKFDVKTVIYCFKKSIPKEITIQNHTIKGNDIISQWTSDWNEDNYRDVISGKENNIYFAHTKSRLQNLNKLFKIDKMDDNVEKNWKRILRDICEKAEKECVKHKLNITIHSQEVEGCDEGDGDEGVLYFRYKNK